MRVEAEYSTKPVVLSILFHLCVVTATMIGWPFLIKPAPTAQPLVIIDVVKLAPDTNLSAQSVKAKASPEPEQEATRRKPPPPPPPRPRAPARRPPLLPAQPGPPPHRLRPRKILVRLQGQPARHHRLHREPTHHGSLWNVNAPHGPLWQPERPHHRILPNPPQH